MRSKADRARFSNPVLPGMHPDPSVCRVGRDFYLACSSFEYFPGVPIYHSHDLVSWRLVGHALKRPSQLRLDGEASSGGIYAPTLRHHDGRFYLVTTHIGRGNFLITADDPRGRWSDPYWLDDEGFDPSLAFVDWRVYYTRTGPGADPDHPFVYQTELSFSDGGARMLRKPRVIWRGTGGVWTEGPHLYRRGRWFYLVTAEGGTSYGHSVVVARGERAYGPFEALPQGPLLTHRARPRHPIQATGHADLVELGDGSTWAVLLGIRPTAGRSHHLGRETFLVPVEWREDGWPRIPALELSMDRPPLRSTTRARPATRDDFSTHALAPGWVFVRNPPTGAWSLRERPGCLRLWGCAASLRDVAPLALVCRRQEHFDVGVRTLLDFDPVAPNEEAGVCVRATEDFHTALIVGCSRRGRELRLVRTLNGRARVVGRLAVAARGPVTLAVEATASVYRFLGGTGRRIGEVGSIPTHGLAAERILRDTGRHHFTGATIGLYATGNGRRSSVPADFHWFDYLPQPE